MPGGEPNLVGAFNYIVPCDSAFETTPTTVEIPLAGCPDVLGMQLVIDFIGFFAHTLPIDSAGTGTILIDLEKVDDSDSDTRANVTGGTAISLETDTMDPGVVRTVYVGEPITLDPGDTLQAEVATDGTLNTASEGAAFVVSGRIVKKSAQ